MPEIKESKQLEQDRNEAKELIRSVAQKYSLPLPSGIIYKSHVDLMLTFNSEAEEQQFAKFIMEEKNKRGLVVFFSTSAGAHLSVPSISTYDPGKLIELLKILDMEKDEKAAAVVNRQP